MVPGPRAGYRTMKMAGSAINRTIKQTKATISICSPSVWPRIEAFRRRGFLTYDTRASGPKFNRGAGRTTGVFFTLKVRSPVCRGPMQSSSPHHCRLTCVPATTPRRSSATAPAMCLEGFDECALLHSEPAAGHNCHEVPASAAVLDQHL